MDHDAIVTLKHGYILERIDNEITVYHPSLTTSIYLNETGAIIWSLCEDGTRSIADIIAFLSAAYPESAERIGPDVTAVVSRLVEQGIAELG